MRRTKEVIAMQGQLTRLLGKEKFETGYHRCTGKWRGTTDHYLDFGDGTRFFVANSTQNYGDRLCEHIRHYHYYATNKDRLSEMTAQVIERDNRQAVQMGFKPITYKGLILQNQPGECNDFWIAAQVEHEGFSFNHVETSFFYALRGVSLGGEEYFDKKINRPDDALGGLSWINEKKPTAILLGYLYKKEFIHGADRYVSI